MSMREAFVIKNTTGSKLKSDIWYDCDKMGGSIKGFTKIVVVGIIRIQIDIWGGIR